MRCQVSYRTDEWPYVKHCQNEAAFVTDRITHGEPDLNDMKICSVHNERFIQEFPERKTTPLEEGPTPLEQ